MDLLWLAQIIADIVLIGAVVLLLLKLGRLGGLRSATSPDDLDQFISEAGQLGREFDRLLSEKRQLVGSTLKTLDQRIDQINTIISRAEKTKAGLEQAAARLDKPVEAPPPRPAQAPDSVDEFRGRVEALSRQGRTPAQIAEATGRPRGEVELVLGLSAGKR